MSDHYNDLRLMDNIKEISNAIALMQDIVRKARYDNAQLLCWPLSLTEQTRETYRQRLSDKCAPWFEPQSFISKPTMFDLPSAV